MSEDVLFEEKVMGKEYIGGVSPNVIHGVKKDDLVPIRYSIQCPKCLHVNTFPEGSAFVECDGCHERLMLDCPVDPLEGADRIVSMTECNGTLYVATGTRVYTLDASAAVPRLVPVRWDK